VAAYAHRELLIRDGLIASDRPLQPAVAPAAAVSASG
jgi:hypothetical protein